MINNQIITICVFTYNSAKTVGETLNSIVKQTYKNLNVIISDDCSKDSTVDICLEWIAQNKNRFHKCIFVQTPHNLGICGNYNYAMTFVETQWFKPIAGDDRLTPNCIERFIVNISDNDRIVCCGLSCFFNDSNKRIIRYEEPLKQRDQLKAVIKTQCYRVVCGAAFFLNKDVIEQYGGFDERYPMAEDFPLCMKFLLVGGHIKQIEEPLVEYRCWNSTSASGNPIFEKSFNMQVSEFLPKACLHKKMYLYYYYYKVTFFISKNSKKGIGYKILGYMMRFFDIINWRNKILKKSPWD